MESYTLVKKRFYGSHQLKGHPRCGNECGHAWTVRITITGDEEPRWFGAVCDETELEQEMDHICRVELAGRDIGAMVKPAISSPMGLCHWFYERLASRFSVTEVEVWFDDEQLGAKLRAP